jgi:predicted kinase
MSQEPNSPQDRGGEKIIRLVRPSVVVLCGPAACGKTTFAERHFRPTQIISSDWARARVCDDERDQRFQAQAFALVHFLIGQRLSLNRLCVVDSTALSSQARQDLLELARKHQVPGVAFLFDVSLEKCLERDQGRQRIVGRAVIERQYRLFEQARGSIRHEGFEQVVELRDEDLNQAKVEIVFRPVATPPPGVGKPAPRTPWREAHPAQSSAGAPSGPRPGRPPAAETATQGPRTSAAAMPAGTPSQAQPATPAGGPDTAALGPTRQAAAAPGRTVSPAGPSSPPTQTATPGPSGPSATPTHPAPSAPRPSSEPPPGEPPENRKS